MKLDLDDDLILYSLNEKQNINGTYDFISLWEFYEIHPSRPKKVHTYGKWSLTKGLEVSKENKWIRRRNLEVP